MEEINLFYIGEKFYWESGTMMSSIYEVGSYMRYDWGFVQRDLAAGKKVTIRPATNEEYGVCARNFDTFKKRNAKEVFNN